MAKNAKKIEDNDLNEVSGGGYLSSYTDEEYEAAGIEVVGPGKLWNDGYKLKETGETLNAALANWAVSFYKEYKRPAKNLNEITQHMDEYLKY